MQHPRTWVEVDLGAVARNLRRIRKALDRRTRILAVVKANAYGHGAVAIGRAALSHGASMLGVGDSGEAIELREAGISAPIVILGAVCDRETEAVLYYRITPTVHSRLKASLLEAAARRAGTLLPVNVMVDTGMGRLGVRPETAPSLIEYILSCRNLRFAGLSTHFSTAHLADTSFTLEQLERFRRVLDELARRKMKPPLVHAANTAALFSLPETHFDMVRPGAGIYGIDPGNLSRLGIELESTLEWHTQIVFLKDVVEGTPIGYGRAYVAPRPMKIATLCVGYNDGFGFPLSNRAEVLVHGRRCRVLGNVTMDYIMADVTDVPGVRAGDTVTLIGRDRNEEITSGEVARMLGVPPYNISTALGRRVKRVYKDTYRAATTPVLDRSRRRADAASA